MDLGDVRRWLNTTPGRLTAGGVATVTLFALVYVVGGFFGDSDAAKASSERMFICAASGKPFEYTLRQGDTIPVLSPHSKEKTGYPAEKCYWTSDGKVKEEPTLVLLEEYKGSAGAPTFCPDCGRRVVAHNPLADASASPPPTAQEYAARTAGKKTARRDGRPNVRGNASGDDGMYEVEQR